MAPLVGVFAVATVAGFGAAIGYRVAHDVVVPLVGRGTDEMKEWWATLHRRDGSERADPAATDEQPAAGT